MTDLTTRVRVTLGSEWDTNRSLWEGLIQLYRADPEAFYLLSCGGSDESGDAFVGPLAALAQWIKQAVRASYTLVPPLAYSEGRAESRVGRQAIPAALFPQVRQFLLDIDGKGTSEKKGKDYEGRVVSEAEMRFKLGDQDRWEADSARVESQRKAKPLVLRVDPEDLVHLAAQPAYVTYALLHCARKTILAPTVVFRGLNRGGDAPPHVNNGWAIFGQPRQVFGNDGTPRPAPAGRVFVVYADEDGYVFDWDWVQEDPDKPGYPLGLWEDRFNKQVVPQPELALELPDNLRPGKFDPKKACYSNRGDCIFCYMTDEESFAERINPDLTVFQRDGTSEHTGFKIKNVRRILQVDKNIVVSDPPGLTVAVDSALMAVSRRQQESVEFYAVLIRRLHLAGQLPKARVPGGKLVGAE
jgi:hypothetical protein